MSSTNRPNKLSCDAFSDANLSNLPNNGLYSGFTNNFAYPLLNVKSIQLTRINFINNSLQLNDYNGQLFFIYHRSEDGGDVPEDGSTLHLVRLHPSWFVPADGFTDYVKNKYFNNGTELVAALNAAASTNGDDTTYNPSWLENDVTFYFDPTTRRISFSGNTNPNYYCPVSADFPGVAELLSTTITMNAQNGVVRQPFKPLVTMNKRLGFAMNYNNRGLLWGANSVKGCATTTGVLALSTGAGLPPTIEGDSFPILLASQNINVYCNVISGTGQDSRRRRNLLATIPIENVPLGVCSYTLTSLDNHVNTSDEINSIQFFFLDDDNNEFLFNPNMNTNLELGIYYN